MQVVERAFKIAIFGESGVGKTALARRYLTGVFETNLKVTMGVEIFVKYLRVSDLKIALQIWDFGGEQQFSFLLPLYSKSANGGIFMFDLCRKSTLLQIDQWLTSFKKGLGPAEPKVPILLLGGKSDLKDKNSVTKGEAQSLVKKYRFLDYFECSSKTGQNIDILFETLVKEILKRQEV